MNEDEIRKIIREEFRLLIPDIVNEIYKEMPPEIIDYRNRIQSAKLHNQEPKRDFNIELEGIKNRLEEHGEKYPERLEPKPDSYRGLSINLQMGNRREDIERIQKRHARVN